MPKSVASRDASVTMAARVAVLTLWPPGQRLLAATKQAFKMAMSWVRNGSRGKAAPR